MPAAVFEFLLSFELISVVFICTAYGRITYVLSRSILIQFNSIHNDKTIFCTNCEHFRLKLVFSGKKGNENKL